MSNGSDKKIRISDKRSKNRVRAESRAEKEKRRQQKESRRLKDERRAYAEERSKPITRGVHKIPDDIPPNSPSERIVNEKMRTAKTKQYLAKKTDKIRRALTPAAKAIKKQVALHLENSNIASKARMEERAKRLEKRKNKKPYKKGDVGRPKN